MPTSDALYLSRGCAGRQLSRPGLRCQNARKTAIAAQVVEVCQRLQSLTSEAIQSVDRSPCYPRLLFSDREPHGPFHSDLELWDAISLTLHNTATKHFPQQALENLRNVCLDVNPMSSLIAISI
jgi:hypothetical protein